MRNPYACAATVILEIFNSYELEDLLPAELLNRAMNIDGDAGKKVIVRLFTRAIMEAFKHAHDADYVKKAIAGFKEEAEEIVAEWKAKDNAAT